MTTVFNADEVFTIGIEIEKNGKKYYDTAAAITDDEDLKKFFLELAHWENIHVSTFEKLKSELKEGGNDETIFDPSNEMHLYLKAAADSHIFRKTLDIEGIAKSCQNPLDILKTALQFEKDSVVLYSSMISMVPENLGKSKVQKMIDEELKHVSIIQTKINLLE